LGRQLLLSVVVMAGVSMVVRTMSCRMSTMMTPEGGMPAARNSKRRDGYHGERQNACYLVAAISSPASLEIGGQ